MTPTVLLAALGGEFAACMLLAALTGWLASKDGYAKGKFDAELRWKPRVAELRRELETLKRGRPRAPWMIKAPVRPPIPGEGGRAHTGNPFAIDAVDQHGNLYPYQSSSSGAASLAPLIYAAAQPPPMRPQPAPSKHGAPETGTMPRIRLVDGTTGEMRKLTDDYIRAIETGRV